MNVYGEALNRLINEFSSLPGIGRRSAERLAFYLLSQPKERSQALSDAIMIAKENSTFCSICQNITDTTPCAICQDIRRDTDVIMVVEDPRDLAALEKTNDFHGQYHVLHGVISPMADMGPEDIKIKELLSRLDTSIKEVIVATNPSVEGEATALYLHRIISPLGIKITRIAHGVPMGGNLEHVDEATLSRALEGRTEMK